MYIHVYVKFGLVIYHGILFFICSCRATTTTVAKTFPKKCIQTVSKFIALIPSHYCQLMLMSLPGVEFSRTVSNFKKRILENCCLAFMFSTKRKIRQFYVQKSVIQVQSCCFANLLFCRCCLSSLLLQAMIDAFQWQVKTYNMIVVFLLLRPVSLVCRSLEVL